MTDVTSGPARRFQSPPLDHAARDRVRHGEQRFSAGVSMLVGEDVAALQPPHELDQLLLITMVDASGRLQAKAGDRPRADEVMDELFEAGPATADVRPVVRARLVQGRGAPQVCQTLQDETLARVGLLDHVKTTLAGLDEIPDATPDDCDVLRRHHGRDQKVAAAHRLVDHHVPRTHPGAVLSRAGS